MATLPTALYALFNATYLGEKVEWGFTFVPVTQTAGATLGGVTKGLATLLTTVASQPTAALRALLLTSVTVNSVKVYGMHTGETTQVYESTTSWIGTRSTAGEYMTSASALGFRSGQPAFKWRGQSFRLPPGSETDAGGQQWSPTFLALAALTTFVTQINNLITVTDALSPSDNMGVLIGVVRRVEYETPKGKKAYRLPWDEGDTVEALPNPSVAVNPFITTQVSRKAF